MRHALCQRSGRYMTVGVPVRQKRKVTLWDAAIAHVNLSQTSVGVDNTDLRALFAENRANADVDKFGRDDLLPAGLAWTTEANQPSRDACQRQHYFRLGPCL